MEDSNMKRKKDFSIIEEIEGDPAQEIPIRRFKLQDPCDGYEGCIHRGRLISDPIKVEGEIKIPRLNPTEEIELKIEASPDNWEKLYSLGISDPEGLVQGIFLNFIEPGFQCVNREKLRDSKSAFTRDSRQYAAAVYVPALYWVKYPAETWPDFFKDLIDKFDDYSKITNPKTHILVASRITHKAWERKFEQQRKKLKLKAKKERLDFKEAYLDGNPYIRLAKDYFDRNNHTLTVKNILKYLKQLP